MTALARQETTPKPDPYSWEGFQARLSALQAAKATTGEQLFFRGHGDSRWRLETTLERRGFPEISAVKYYGMFARSKHEIQASTGQACEIPAGPELKAMFSEYNDQSARLTFGEGIPHPSYLVFGRHHTFPSPLLDWTRSPYIAAMFAFAPPENPREPMRSVIAWAEPHSLGGGSDQPELKRMGPYLPAHHRHFAQQADYTVCMRYSTEKKDWFFIPHLASPAFVSEEGPSQTLFRFDIRSSERKKVVAILDQFNLNPHTLYGSHESLMETIANRLLDPQRPAVKYESAECTNAEEKSPR